MKLSIPNLTKALTLRSKYYNLSFAIRHNFKCLEEFGRHAPAEYIVTRIIQEAKQRKKLNLLQRDVQHSIVFDAISIRKLTRPSVTNMFIAQALKTNPKMWPFYYLYTDQSPTLDISGESVASPVYTPYGVCTHVERPLEKRIERMIEPVYDLKRDIIDNIHLHPVLKARLLRKLSERIRNQKVNF
jgi:hypothetical protein